jgi:hypothetical protein
MQRPHVFQILGADQLSRLAAQRKYAHGAFRASAHCESQAVGGDFTKPTVRVQIKVKPEKFLPTPFHGVEGCYDRLFVILARLSDRA